MKIRKLLLFVAALICFVCGHAQNNLKVILKDGSELVGYISRQRPGENFSFTTSSAIVSVNIDKVKSIEDNRIREGELSNEWRQWAKQNGVLMKDERDSTYLILSDIVISDKLIHGVRVLERGAKLKYLDLAPNTYSLSWDTIAIIKAEPRPKLQLSGINRRYKLRSGMEYEGQYVEEIPGCTLSLYQNDGVIMVFKREEVLKDNRYKINPDQSIFEQSDLIDVVQLKSGSLCKGIIIERNYSDTDTISSDYLLIQSENGMVQSVNLADVLEYRKELNPLYHPLTDVMLNEGEFMVNRMNVKPRIAKEIQGIICFNVDSIDVVIPQVLPTTDIVVEAKFASSFRLSQLKLVKVKTYYDKRKKETVYGLTYEDLVKDAVLPLESTKSINGVTRMNFNLEEDGIYSLYNPDKKEVLLFEITTPASSL